MSRAAFGLTLCFVVGLLSSGCQSLEAYDGGRRARDEVALIVGDFRITAGAPLSILLRSVDGVELGLRQRSAAVLPGAHDLLIDCTVTDSKRTSRHHLRVEVEAGETYVLRADTGQGNTVCSEVALIERP
jgi:hypothetical protein